LSVSGSGAAGAEPPDQRLGREASRRRKQGFAPPTDRWFRGPRGQQLAAIVGSDAAFARGWLDPAFVRRLIGEHQLGAVNHGQRLWLLLMLELWFRMFVDQTLSRGDDLFEVAAEKAVAA
jgi:Asparagine synthase